MQELCHKIESRKAKIAVIGLGYVGLPLAYEFALAGFSVLGIDINEKRVANVNAGKNYVQDIDDQILKDLVGKGQLRATTDFAVLKDTDAVSVCVPTPLSKNKEPDVSYIISSIEQVANYLHPGQAVVLESTTYPGTTQEIVLPILEKNGLKVGKDFFLAFSPERIDPGNKKFGLKNTPKVIGGCTNNCSEVVQALYQSIIDKVLKVSTPAAAEMVKLLENTFRAINIGLANEVALMCDVLGINVWEVIDAAKTKPFGFMPFYPGPGLGGHCIPVDSHYLSWKLRSHDFYSRFIELAAQINNNMPRYVVDKVTKLLNEHQQCVNGSKILVLGMSYKKDIGDTRESPAIAIFSELKRLGADIYYNDPYVTSIKIDETFYESVHLSEQILATSDCVLLVSDHSIYDHDFIVKNATCIFDTRNAIKSDHQNVRKL